MVQRATNWDEFFAGAVPPFAIFETEVDGLRQIVSRNDTDQDPLSSAPMVCLIALVAHFEGFCKNQFAALVNICPQLLRDFSARGRNVEISATHILDVDHPVSAKLGFLVADRFDFGTPKTINALYTDLLQVTPFGKKEAARFAQILDDRNVLVHHDGILGPRYSKERFIRREAGRNRLFMDSLVVTSSQFEEAASLLLGIGRKTAAATKRALSTYVRSKGIRVSRGAKTAIDFLTMD
jgi:hypothetical protein